MRNTLWIGIVSLLLLSAGLFVGCGKDEEERKVAPATTAVPVQIAQIVRGDIGKTFSYTGQVEAWREISVAPDIAGKVAKIYVKEGDRVQEGQILAELDTRAGKLRLEQAQAGLSVARASLNDAAKNWERIKKLHEEGTLSPQQYEKAQLGHEAAKARLEQAQAALDLAQYQLDVSVMKAPFPGQIAGKYINEGETINPMMPGGRGVVRLMDLSKVKIRVPATETQIRAIHVGQKARIRVDSYPEKAFEGAVYTISPAADPRSRAFEVQLVAPNSKEELKAGMFARVELVIAEHKDVILIPEASLLQTPTEAYVFTVEHDKAVKRIVQIGLSEKDRVEVTDGLEEGMRIITAGTKMVTDGVNVEIKGGETR